MALLSLICTLLYFGPTGSSLLMTGRFRSSGTLAWQPTRPCKVQHNLKAAKLSEASGLRAPALKWIPAAPGDCL